MNFLIEIGHPAHVHFFRRSIARLGELGHRVRIVTRAKEITNALLDRLGIPYDCLSTPASGGIALALELGSRWAQMIRLIRKHQIQAVASISGISTSLPGRFCGIRNVVFTDTEDARLSNRIAFPFADEILTPRFYQGDLGPKHRRYEGLHELAYLQKFDFDEAARLRKSMGLPERYSLVRLVANDALHDRDIRGLSREELSRILEYLKSAGDVFITSQGELPRVLDPYRLKVPIEEVHAVLAGAQAFFGESPTMAVESSLLGTPSFLISGRVGRLGNMICLEKEFRLLRCFETWERAAGSLPAVEELPVLKQDWRSRAQSYRASCEDMDSLILGALLKGAS